MQQGIECLNSCIFDWLRRDLISINMSDIFFLGNGLKIHYTGRYSTHMIYSQQYRANFRFINKYATDSIMGRVEDEDYEEKKDFLVNAIEKYKSIIIRVSSSELPYNKKFVKGKNISHYIIVNQYKNGFFQVRDFCPPTMDTEGYIGFIEEKELIRNWEIMNCEYLILMYKREVLESKKIIKKTQKYRNIQIKNYINNKSFLISNTYDGNGCLLLLLEDLEILFKKNTSEIKDIICECNRQLRIDGYLQAKMFVLDSILIFNDETLASEYRKIVYQWDKEFVLLLKAGIKKDYALYKRVLDETNALIQKENIILKNCF